MGKRISLADIVRGGMLLALAIALPIAFHSFRLAAKIFLPMHVPLVVAGYIVGPGTAFIVGFTAPLFSSFLTGMPPLLSAWQMAFELAFLGSVIAYLRLRLKSGRFTAFFLGLVASRVASMVASIVIMRFFSSGIFDLNKFITAAFITSLPGIGIQLLSVYALGGFFSNKKR